jgi:hypothetical protein
MKQAHKWLQDGFIINIILSIILTNCIGEFILSLLSACFAKEKTNEERRSFEKMPNDESPNAK